jgi:Uma2 family endonuclease
MFFRIGGSFLGPDVAWWAEGREPPIGPGAIDSVPDLVVEILSRSTRENDLGPKRRVYMEGGVRELWLIDPAEGTAVIASSSGERRLSARDELTSPLLEGFAIPLSDLFA